MGKLKPVLVLGVAAVVALIATSIIYTSIKKNARGGKEAVIETQPIAVAIIDLHWGTKIRKEMVRMEPFLKRSLPAGSFSDSSNLVGRVIISPVKALEPILESRLAPVDVKSGGVSAVVSPKKRAVAVKVDKVIGVAGFIYPGNRVDVLVTISSQKMPEAVTKTVLENVLVLAVGLELQDQAKGREEKASPVDVITLEVNPQDAEKLALAASEGKVQLALRNHSDTEEMITQGINIPNLLTSYSGGREAKPVIRKVAEKRKFALDKPSALIKEKDGKKAEGAPTNQEKPLFVVDLIRGANVNKVNFDGSGDLWTY